jgi:hypothetical protein
MGVGVLIRAGCSMKEQYKQLLANMDEVTLTASFDANRILAIF